MASGQNKSWGLSASIIKGFVGDSIGKKRDLAGKTLEMILKVHLCLHMNVHKSLEHRVGFCWIENKYCFILRGNLILTDEWAHFLRILYLLISLRA